MFIYLFNKFFYFILFYFIQSVLNIHISSIYFILFYFIQSVLNINISTIYFILFYFYIVT